MSPKYLLALSVAAVGLVFTQSSLRADDTVQPPPPGVDAPPPPPPAGHGGREGFKLAELTAKLSLTPDQVKTIEPIIESARTQGKAIHEDTTLSRQEKHIKMKAIMADTRTQIRATLTADQQKTFDTLPTHGQKPPGAPQENGSTPPPPAPPGTT
jgi:hypothetical protein